MIDGALWIEYMMLTVGKTWSEKPLLQSQESIATVSNSEKDLKLKLYKREKSQPSTLDHVLPREPVTHWKWQAFLVKTNHLQNQDYFVTTQSLSCSQPGVRGTQVGATPTDARVTAKTGVMDVIFAAWPDCKKALDHLSIGR